VVRNWDELDSLKDKVKGKIVVYNEPWVNYGTTVAYRANGASRAAKYGALAALVRSVTPDSIESVHTGIQYYDGAYPSIPVAAITTEDAEMMYRMQARNQTITLHLIMESLKVSGCNSSNLVFELKGATLPDEIFLMGGHIDSWDTGSQTGANDDGGGFITVFEAMRLLKKNGYQPKRTLRFIAWSGEEWGDPNNGAQQYARNHKDELAKHIIAFENDLGNTRLLGFGYNGPEAGLAIVKDIADKYMNIINSSLVNDEGHGSDTSPLYNLGVPVMANSVYDTVDHKFYFTYHHSMLTIWILMC
jgi:carboxypeptidase Q